MQANTRFRCIARAWRRLISRSPVAKDVLRKVNGAWKVKGPTIVLDANVLLDKNLSGFL